MADRMATRRAQLNDPIEGGELVKHDRLLTAKEVADRWQVPKQQVYRLSREGRLATVRIGRHYRYRRSAVEAFELEGGRGTDG